VLEGANAVLAEEVMVKDENADLERQINALSQQGPP
jgi:hypothetical protein